jgi:Spy/CpxP family protein refolding chaperone
MKRTVLILVFLCSLARLYGQQPQDDPIAQNLFPPELVMNHQNEIGLREEQRASIRSEIQKAQLKFVDLQWRLQDESEKMVLLLRQRLVDESKVLSQAEAVMNLEREIKKTHLSLLIRIKNSLSEEQQARLSALRIRKP